MAQRHRFISSKQLCFLLIQVFLKSSHEVHSTPLTAEVIPSPPSNTAPPRSSASPSNRSSPFRFTGHAQAHFSPSVLSSSPSPPRVSSPHPPERPGTSYRPESPQRSLSSLSVRSEVLSLDELFPVETGSERPLSEMSSVSSEGERCSSNAFSPSVQELIGLSCVLCV